ncbi:hypothetical protein Plhal703r1_c23g0099711 [Plasmopara halstedii]
MMFMMIEAIAYMSIVKPLTLESEQSNRNATRLEGSKYWTADQPYKYQPHWTRLPSGKVIVTKDSNASMFTKYRSAVETKTPWISNWVLSAEGRRTMKKEIPRLLLYNLVSPMDYGNSVRSGNVRRRRNKAFGMFFTDNLALPLVKSLGHVALNVFQNHYVDYFKDQMFAQRLQMMNSSELIQAFNLSLSKEMIQSIMHEETRVNTTLQYVYDGESKRLILYAQYTKAFEPYEGYSNQYYTIDDNFTIPTFPADSYPWLWSSQIDVVRIVTYQLVESLNQDEETINDTLTSIDMKSRNSSRMLTNKIENVINGFDDNSSTRANLSDGEMAINAHEIGIFEQLKLRFQDFHYDTGIPRLTFHSKTSQTLFPSRMDFVQNSIHESNHRLDGDNGRDEVGDLRAREAVYDALTHFYSYPLIANWSIQRFSMKNLSRVNCSIQQVCLIQSGVTVYTPSLTNLALNQLFSESHMSSISKRALRLEALQSMIQIAFEAERRVLNHGLQGPSTVWYSTHDLDVDEFADAVLGTFNLSISGETEAISPLHVFEKHMNEHVPILDAIVSYYADTNHETKVFMKNHYNITMDVFNESQVTQLIETFQYEVQQLEQSLVSYKQARDINVLHQEVVNATIRHDFYNGSEYTLVSFGFILPATNEKNVLYRDMKLPIPFHLILRLMIRFQESHLLLPQESRQLLVCLAMAYYDISFYRCRSTTTSNED